MREEEEKTPISSKFFFFNAWIKNEQTNSLNNLLRIGWLLFVFEVFSSMWFRWNFYRRSLLTDRFSKEFNLTTLIDILWKKYTYKCLHIYVSVCDTQEKSKKRNVDSYTLKWLELSSSNCKTGWVEHWTAIVDEKRTNSRKY